MNQNCLGLRVRRAPYLRCIPINILINQICEEAFPTNGPGSLDPGKVRCRLTGWVTDKQELFDRTLSDIFCVQNPEHKRMKPKFETSHRGKDPVQLSWRYITQIYEYIQGKYINILTLDLSLTHSVCHDGSYPRPFWYPPFFKNVPICLGKN